jgi:hypothetical protein
MCAIFITEARYRPDLTLAVRKITPGKTGSGLKTRSELALP